MINNIDVSTSAADGTASHIGRLTQVEADATPSPFAIPRHLPFTIDGGQAYYWRYAWQLGERESRKELEEGLGRTFRRSDDAIRWLLFEGE